MRIKNIIKEEINKVLNEDTLYHGSNYDFEDFDLAYINKGSGSQNHGHGIYLAKEMSDAQAYGKFLYTVEIPKVSRRHYLYQDKKPTTTMSYNVFNTLFNYLKELDEYKGCERQLEQEMSPMLDCYDGESLYGSVKYMLGSYEEASRFCRQCGIYGIVYKLNNNLAYVIFDKNDIKIINKQ